MAEDAIEIELKFLCDPAGAEAALAVAPEGPETVTRLEAVYYDTPDRRLDRKGATLRVRLEDGRPVQAVKRGQGARREEQEAPIDGEAPVLDWPILRKLLGGEAELAATLNVDIERRRRRVEFEGAQVEIALDRGALRAGAAREPVHELELELKSGGPDALFALARRMAAAAPLHLSLDSKAARGRALSRGEAGRPRHSGAPLLPEAPDAAGLFRAAAADALAQVCANAEVMRERPEPEAVHQLRVGLRRLRSLLSACKPLLKDDPALEAVKAELKWAAKACDAARELHVLLDESVAPAMARGDPAAGLAELALRLQAARDEAQARAAELCAGARFRALLVETAAFVFAGDWAQGPAAGEPARDFAARALEKRRRKLLRRGADLAALDDPSRHRVRIDGKKLRYAAEAFAPLFEADAVAAHVKQVKRLQDQLGAMNDAAGAQDRLLALRLQGSALYAAGHVTGRMAAGRDRALKRAVRAMERLAGAEPFW